MATRLTIGEFALMTHLSKKALRYYHELGLLEPAHTDPHTGYRHYATDQVAQAQVIRCYRDLDMPLPEVKAALAAESIEDRNAVIAAHLRRMEEQLRETDKAVQTMRELLAGQTSPLDVEFRSLAATQAWAASAMISLSDYDRWYSHAFEEIRLALAGVQQAPLGPLGALTTSELFTEDEGLVTLFVPMNLPAPADTTLVDIQLPATRYAVAVHLGDRANADRTCGALGSYVMDRQIGASGPVRENFVSLEGTSPSRTEICWPVLSDAQ